MINEHHILGEKNTGYEDEAGLGEFSCENCKYFKPVFNRPGRWGACNQTEMMIYSRHPRMPGGQEVIVDPQGCCEYVERVGRNTTRPVEISGFE